MKLFNNTVPGTCQARARHLLWFLLFGLGLSPLGAFVLEDFNSTATIRTDSVDTGSSGSGAKETGVEGNAFKFTYDLGTGNYAQFYKDYSYVNWAFEGGNTLRFRAKASGSNANLEIKLTDFDTSASSSSDKLDLKIPLQTDNQWRTYTVHFSSFSLFGDGNSSFNLHQVSRMAFAVVALSSNTYDRGSGTVWLDKVELYKSASTLIDNFDDGDIKNFLGEETIAIPNTSGITGNREITSVSGNNVLKFEYDVSANSSHKVWLRVPLKEKNFLGYTHVSFKIRGVTKSEVLRLQLESPVSSGYTGQSSVLISNYLSGGITTSLREVQVPLSTFSAVNVSTLSALVLEASNSAGSGSGAVYVDDIAFVRSEENSGAVRTIDDLDHDVASTNWDASAHSDANLTATTVLDASVPGASSGNRVYKLEYSFKQSGLLYITETPYVIIERLFFLNIAPYSKLSFNYKGTGSSNNLELKLTDSDDTTWVKKFSQITNTGGEWKTASFPLDQLAFFGAGTDSDLNMKKIKKVWFAITKSGGTSGTFSVDTIEAPETGDYSTSDGSRLISSFKVINNPFSPNGDKVKDECFFAYSLSSASKVSLKIHGLDGVERKVLFSGDQSSGEQSVAWDGTDSNGDKIPNGLYLYRLEAEGVDNRKDSLVQVIAVLK